MKLETSAIHAGYQIDATTRSAVPPIYQTTSYVFDNTQHGADLFNLAVPGNIYTRIMNPTHDVLEKRVAELEGGVGALAVSSGMAAINYAIETICSAGDNIVSTQKLYGGTYNLFADVMPRKGIEVRFADYQDPASFIPLIDDKTKAIFCESIGNPGGNVTDIEALSKIAHSHGIPLMVDNTVATPYLCPVFELGADIAIYSLTKYMGGHGNTIGGAIIDSGRFPWKDDPVRFSLLNQPDKAYHDVIYTEAFKEMAFIGRARTGPLRNTGAALSPLSAFLLLQGIETLPLRMERHCENTLKVAQFLQAHPRVSWVSYAGLPDHPDYEVAQRTLSGGRASGILTFGIKGGEVQCARFIDRLQLILRLVNIGDVRSLACHPASTTHRQLNAEALAKVGVTEETIRLSVGLEHIDDIIADITQALE
jgi:O-acetylhomoserine (thiol)-lyase